MCITCFEVQKLSFWHHTEGGEGEEEPSRFKRNGSPNLGPSREGRGSKEVWDSYLFKNFPQFVVIHTGKGFPVVNEAEVDVFLEFPCFFCSVLGLSVMSNSQAPLSMGILPAILEWVAMPSSRESSQPRDRIQVSYITGGFFTS